MSGGSGQYVPAKVEETSYVAPRSSMTAAPVAAPAAKSKCPSWCWGLLALLGAIMLALGILWGLGVFGGIDKPSGDIATDSTVAT